ncbi:MAG: hypothetical protein ACRC1W_17195 [Shewanella sp.]
MKGANFTSTSEMKRYRIPHELAEKLEGVTSRGYKNMTQFVIIALTEKLERLEKLEREESAAAKKDK